MNITWEQPETQTITVRYDQLRRDMQCAICCSAVAKMQVPYRNLVSAIDAGFNPMLLGLSQSAANAGIAPEDAFYVWSMAIRLQEARVPYPFCDGCYDAMQAFAPQLE